ncbi:hypothetical protein BC936DRAFT_139583 [Jimgerdemannia flammicorona]|uniref:RBR-type E3 ubiquitin transferase n=1 Tax=Jimgerdemannia flammicorona TaxID=994334 RepID=A0A433DHK1_9FUNG|nr:hypothetical protein BC936DRAFT_139583 [Jimgerdemannia flammicorona]
MASDAESDGYIDQVEDTMDEDSEQEDEYDSTSMHSDDDDPFMEEDNEDLGFEGVVADKNRKRTYEVEFSVHSVANIVASQQKEVSQVSSILGIRQEHSATLLRHFRWNKERLIERYMDDPDKVMLKAGIITNNSLVPHWEPAAKFPGFMCDICCDDDADLQTLSLSCRHRFCGNCYRHYLSQKIREEGESRRIQCPQDGCNVIVDEETVKTAMDKETHAKYRSLLNRTYVDDNDYLRWCPAPNCEFAIECHVPASSLQTIVPSVVCQCQHRFCFGCGLGEHQPAVCALVKKWIKKCEDDSETANWISAHTKECPKCHSTIEKNGGCNHMTCRKCKYECKLRFNLRGYPGYDACFYHQQTLTSITSNRTSPFPMRLQSAGCVWDRGRSMGRAGITVTGLMRSHHRMRGVNKQSQGSHWNGICMYYYNRYANHEQSMKLDRDLYSRTEKKMEDMQATSELSWIEVQFLRKAVDTLCQCRMTLKWTYAFAFYLQKNNMTEIFEDNQKDLEMATEQLSELLEKPIEREKVAELRQNVLDKTVYVASRREILLEDTAKGLLEGRWSYIVDLK